MTQEQKDAILQAEIIHIIESGDNEIRLMECFKRHFERHYQQPIPQDHLKMKYKYNLGDEVYYPCDAASFIVVGIRENQIEIKGDWSGGTHNINEPSWVGVDEIEPFDYSKMKIYDKTYNII